MLTYVPFEELDYLHLEQIAKSLLVAPPEVRAKELLPRLQRKDLACFTWPDGLMLIGKLDNRLLIEAMSASIWGRQDLAKDLRRLAADWECDTIQTTVFDSRLASAIVKVGGQIESYDMILPVGTDDEQ